MAVSVVCKGWHANASAFTKREGGQRSQKQNKAHRQEKCQLAITTHVKKRYWLESHLWDSCLPIIGLQMLLSTAFHDYFQLCNRSVNMEVHSTI